ncbi:MAG: Ig-like domain-containing protein [Gemmatimonadales bacterium]
MTADNGVDPTVTWTTGTPAVATVNAAGLATAVTPGTTTVVATSVATPATSGTASLVVRAPVVSNVAVTPSAATLFAAETLQLTATVTADPGVSTTVTWSSSNESAATVSPTGLVTAVALVRRPSPRPAPRILRERRPPRSRSVPRRR